MNAGAVLESYKITNPGVPLFMAVALSATLESVKCGYNFQPRLASNWASVAYIFSACAVVAHIKTPSHHESETFFSLQQAVHLT